MADNRNSPSWEEHKNQDIQQNEDRGSKEEVSNEQRPKDRLKDGTNDLQSGDQDSNLGEPSERSSGESNSSQTGT
jgi:hypothetical protein